MKRIIVLSLCFLIASCMSPSKNTSIKGSVFGTTYSIIYNSPIDFEKEFDELFFQINKSMSTYLPNSDISKINRNEDVKVDGHFVKVLEASRLVYEETYGAFDPTIGAVVNAWDFGPEGKIMSIDSSKIDSLMVSVGLREIQVTTNNTIQKQNNTYLDFNAIAKGYAVDVIGQFLEDNNVYDYLVEIGGEIRAKGMNMEKDQAWMVGIDLPSFEGEQALYSVISLENEAMATSGTYRKYKIDDQGNRYAHIIDTKTGFPSQTNILSVSVITESCMMADAYATAFQTMGINKVKSFLELHPELKVMMIYADIDNELKSAYLNNFPEQ